MNDLFDSTKEGFTTRDIEEKFGIANSGVNYAIKQLGLTPIGEALLPEAPLPSRLYSMDDFEKVCNFVMEHSYIAKRNMAKKARLEKSQNKQEGVFTTRDVMNATGAPNASVWSAIKILNVKSLGKERLPNTTNPSHIFPMSDFERVCKYVMEHSERAKEETDKKLTAEKKYTLSEIKEMMRVVDEIRRAK